jgi:hypothetical protein
MKASLVRAIVEIRNANDKLLGTGIYVSRKRVLTCRHVVEAAEPVGALLDDEALRIHGPGAREGERVVDVWAPEKANGYHRDIALVTVLPDPARVNGVVLPWNRLFGSRGRMPLSVTIAGQGLDGTPGVQVLSAEVVGRDRWHGCYYLNLDIARGFSGGLVAREVEGEWRAVGMIVARASDATGGGKRAYFLPQEQLSSELGKVFALPRARRERRVSPPPTSVIDQVADGARVLSEHVIQGGRDVTAAAQAAGEDVLRQAHELAQQAGDTMLGAGKQGWNALPLPWKL